MSTSHSEEKTTFYILGFLACLFISYFAHDIFGAFKAGQPIGWDFTLTCAGVDAYTNGLDPYYVKNLKNTQLSYSYLPFTLDLFRPVCHNAFLGKHYKILYPFLGVVCVFLLSSFSFQGRFKRELALKALFIFAGFAGFQWVFRTGNIAMFDGVLTALGLFSLFRGNALQEGAPRQAWAAYILGSLVLGFSTALKILYCPLLLGLYFLPVERSRKFILLILAVFAFAVPIIGSYFFYHDLFYSWVACTFGQIPGQHSASTEGYNPSFYWLVRVTLANLNMGEKQLILSLLGYAAGVLLIMGSFLFQIWRVVIQNTASGDTRSFLSRLNSLLVTHPKFAMRVVLLSMVALFLCSPRLKEYGYFELSLYMAMLVVDLPIGELLLTYFLSIAIPILSNQPQLKLESLYFSGFDQLVVATFCYFLLIGNLGTNQERSSKARVNFLFSR